MAPGSVAWQGKRLAVMPPPPPPSWGSSFLSRPPTRTLFHDSNALEITVHQTVCAFTTGTGFHLSEDKMRKKKKVTSYLTCIVPVRRRPLHFCVFPSPAPRDHSSTRCTHEPPTITHHLHYHHTVCTHSTRGNQESFLQLNLSASKQYRIHYFRYRTSHRAQIFVSTFPRKRDHAVCLPSLAHPNANPIAPALHHTHPYSQGNA